MADFQWNLWAKNENFKNSKDIYLEYTHIIIFTKFQVSLIICVTGISKNVPKNLSEIIAFKDFLAFF